MAVGHTVFMRQENIALKERLNSKQKGNRGKSKGVRVRVELLTSAESRQRHAEEEARQKEKQMKADERSRMDGSESFKGSLSTKNKQDLLDIAIWSWKPTLAIADCSPLPQAWK
ncbi:hypothetical protein WOLCODRAFT_159187 [Wolfiporia cocos MD-104 SS10]|uniref:Uncharacterized protein n=1 Tax=Wolfiporia cocos (strain MD-104) TaxID=742152 RepID=A0A2H3JSG6_WOLCO|nr:hypothetical protein WOLCODRAFT_159187 [Wolfiporia cocos MD-104 SS10]